MNRKLLGITLGLIALPVFASPHFGYGKSDDEARGNCQKHEGKTMDGGMRKGPMQAMTEVLALRDDQVEPVNKIIEETRVARHELGRGDREGHQALHEQTVEKMRGVLDEQQLGKFVAFTQGMRTAHQMMRHRFGRGEHGHGEHGYGQRHHDDD